MYFCQIKPFLRAAFARRWRVKSWLYHSMLDTCASVLGLDRIGLEDLFFWMNTMAQFFTLRSFYSFLTSGLLLIAASLPAQAQTGNAQAESLRQTAQSRYEADQQLCADEASAEARLQCRRDAQAIYNKAIAAIGSAVTPAPTAACNSCGLVTAVRLSEKTGASGAVGLIAGGLAGAVLGHQVGGGFGKDLATIAGAAGGAYAGKKIEENVNSRKLWTVSVRYNDGTSAEFDYEQDPGFKAGDAVRKSGNVLVRN